MGEEGENNAVAPQPAYMYAEGRIYIPRPIHFRIVVISSFFLVAPLSTVEAKVSSSTYGFAARQCSISRDNDG